VKDLKNRLIYPNVGDIYLHFCKPVGLDWGHYHLLVTDLFETLQYRNDTCAARCLVLESGGRFECYADTLQMEGEKVA